MVYSNTSNLLLVLKTGAGKTEFMFSAELIHFIFNIIVVALVVLAYDIINKN